MAQHISINEFKNELWFVEIKSNIIDTIMEILIYSFYLMNIALMEVIQFLNTIHMRNMI